jgi:hypothetical protein
VELRLHGQRQQARGRRVGSRFETFSQNAVGPQRAASGTLHQRV